MYNKIAPFNSSTLTGCLKSIKEHVQQVPFLFTRYNPCCLIPIKEYVQQVHLAYRSIKLMLFKVYKRTYTTRASNSLIRSLVLFKVYKRTYTTSGVQSKRTLPQVV